MTETSILTSKGQTTIPKEVRDFLGLTIGDRIIYVIEAGEVKIQAARQQIDALFGAFDASGIDEEQSRQETPGEQGILE